MTHTYSYDELFRAADKLWPGEAESILFNPTDEQLALIFAVLRSSPVDGFMWSEGSVANSDNTQNSPLVNFRIGVEA